MTVDIAAAIKMANAGPETDFKKLITFIFADKGTGKSTLGTRFPKPFFLDFEDRLRTATLPDGSGVPKMVAHTWDDAENFLKAFEGTTPEDTGVDTLVIDGMGVGFKYLRTSVLSKYKVDHENEGVLAYGKGKGLIIDKLEGWFTRLRKLTTAGYGIVLTAHERTLEFENNGVQFDKKVPLISGDKSEYGWNAIKPFPDIVIHAYKSRGKNGPEHRMHLVGTELWEAAFSKPGVDNSKIADLPFSYQQLEAAWID